MHMMNRPLSTLFTVRLLACFLAMLSLLRLHADTADAEKFAERLRSHDPEARTAALMELNVRGVLPPAMDLRHIIDLLDDQTRVIARDLRTGATISTSPSEASMELLRRQPDIGVPALKVALVEHRTSVRWRAAHLLGQIATPDAITSLLGAMTQDADRLVRMTASEGLVRLGPLVVPYLMEMLGSEVPEHRNQAIYILSEVGDERTVEPLLDIALGETSRHADLAANALLKMGPRIVPSVLRVVEGDYPNEQKARALRIASGVNDTIALEAIIYTLLTHPDNFIRAQALFALESHTRNPDIVDALLNVQNDIDRSFADMVPEIMRRLDSRAAVTLEWYLTNPDPQMQHIAIEGLKTIGLRAIPSFLYIVESDGFEHSVRVSAANYLKRMGYRAIPFRPRLMAMTIAGDWPGLSGLTRQIRPHLEEMLSHPQEYIREGSLLLLSNLKTSELVDKFILALDDPSPNVRLAAEKALRETDRPGFPQMVNTLDRTLRLSTRTIAHILSEGGYRPRTDLDRVRFFAAKEDWQQIEFLGESALALLVESLRGSELRPSAWAAMTLSRLARRTDLSRLQLSLYEPSLSDLLYETDEQLLSVAYRSLGGAADRQAIAILMVALFDQNPQRSRRAAEAIGVAGVAALEMLELFLASDFSHERSKALEACEQIGLPAASLLLKHIFDENFGADVVRVLDQMNFQPRNNDEMVFYLLASGAYGRLANLGRPAMQPLTLASQKADNPDRLLAIEALGASNDTAAVEPLMILLNDPAPHIREAATQALLALGPVAVDPLKKLTRTGNLVTCRNAARTLHRMGYPPANDEEEAWLLACRQDWAELRRNKKDVHRNLRPYLLSQLHAQRAIATAALAALRDYEVFSDARNTQAISRQLVANLQHENPEVRAMSAHTAGLYFYHYPLLVPHLERLLDDDSPVAVIDRSLLDIEVPRTPGGQAAAALARIGTPSVEVLLKALQGTSSVAASNARIAIAYVQDPRLLFQQILNLRDPRMPIRYQTCLALGRAGRSDAVSALVTAGIESDASVRAAAAQALVDIGEQGVSLLVEDLRITDNLDKQRFIIDVLARLGNPQAIEVLRTFAKGPIITLRKAALTALAANTDTRGILLAIEGLEDEYWTVRETAAHQLALRGPHAIEPLITRMETARPDTQRQIERVLQQITGQSFGSQIESWKKWMEDNKPLLIQSSPPQAGL